jgi:hypothetical protein
VTLPNAFATTRSRSLVGMNGSPQRVRLDDWMQRRLIAMLAIVLLGGCAGLTATPYPARTPAPLPGDATAIELPTVAGGRPGGAPDVCPTALLPPVTLGFDGATLTYTSAEGASWGVLWPRGFSARLRQEQAEIVSPAGAIVGSQGQLLNGLGGASGGGPGDFVVCQVGAEVYGPAS